MTTLTPKPDSCYTGSIAIVETIILIENLIFFLAIIFTPNNMATRRIINNIVLKFVIIIKSDEKVLFILSP